MTKNFDPFGFSNVLPSSVGFDRVFRTLEDMTKAASVAVGYPPYNIKKVDDNKYVVELAVAGFAKQDIELELHENTLTIKGNTSLDTALKDGIDVTYLHKGIADRNFVRKFTLADSVEIQNASLINGMLKIWLEHIIPESKKPVKININSGEQAETGKTEGKSKSLLME